jgi:exonuclease III
MNLTPFFVPKHVHISTANKKLDELTMRSGHTTGCLSIFHQNIGGLYSKLDQLEIALKELRDAGKDFDVVCLCETFIREGSQENIKLNNFKLASAYCREKGRGGTCILIKKHIETKQVPYVTKLASKFCFECCGVELVGLGLIIINIYRTPDQKKTQVGLFLYKLDTLLNYLISHFKRKKIVICGDWNINIIKHCEASKELINVLQSYNLNAHILKPTRLGSCIDQIASNIKQVTAEIHYLGLSDHETAQSVTLPTVQRQKGCTTWYEYRRDFSPINIRKFCECISSLTFSEVTNSITATTGFQSFYELICLLFNLCFPTVKVKVNNRPILNNWLSRGLKKSCKVKRTLYFKFKTTNINKQFNKAKYKKYNCILKRCLLYAQKVKSTKYIQNSQNKCQATWKLITNSVSNNLNENDIHSLQSNNQLFSNPNDICDILNTYFIDSTKLKATLPNMLPPRSQNCSASPANQHTIFLNPVNEAETYKIIMALSNSKASGHDSITTEILKLCASYICIPLTHVINLSFVEGIFPKDLKYSIVKPMFKKGDKQDPCNYRPIALIPIMSKIFEKAFHARLNNFLTKYDILCPEQYGFRVGKSTTLACYDLVKYITESINNGIPITSIFLDMTRAFDFVNHSKLLCKLDHYGIRGKALDWIKSYLSDRMQCTEINKLVKTNNVLIKKAYRSHYKVNNTGVPQGSILGPLLFVLYINELPKATPHKSILFADDTTIVIKCNDRMTYEQDINNALNDIIHWMNINDLNININKSKWIQFISYNSNILPITLKYNNENVEEVESFKFLGFTLDRHLHWKYHTEQVCNKLNRFVFALRRLRDTVSVEASLIAYHGYVSSVLRYGLILWGNSVDAERAFKIQKKCVRVICSSRLDDSCIPLFRKMRILPLPCLYIRDACIFVNTRLSDFRTRGDMMHRQTRKRIMDLLYKPLVTKAIYGKNVANMCIKLYNNLPDDIKVLRGNCFNNKLTNWLLDKCFYNVKNYLEYK